MIYKQCFVCYALASTSKPTVKRNTIISFGNGDTINGTGYGLSDANASYELEAGDYKYFYTAELRRFIEQIIILVIYNGIILA